MSEQGLLIACALASEADLLGRLLPAGEWCIEVTGIGIKRTRRRLSGLLARLRPRLLIFTGSAGGLDPALRPGAVVFPERWQLEDGALFTPDAAIVAKLRDRGWKVEGTGCTVSRPVVDPEHRSQLWRDRQALICDMEAAAALEVADGLGIPAIALKVVADSFREPSAAADPDLFQDRLRSVIPNLAAALARLMAGLPRV